MTTSRTLWLRAIACAVACAACAPLSLPAQNVAPTGVFEGSTDVGAVLHAGAVKYDASARSYTVSGSGENMWFASDAFQFVWKRVSGDVTLTADIAFPVKGGNAHRKAILTIRQSLDADSAYADAALHGDGLTSLQARTEKGAITHEVQANETAPGRLRIVKRGDQVYIFLASAGEPLRFAGGSMRLALKEPFYVGIAVCSHEKDAVETAVFSNVELTSGAPSAATQPRLYSTLETVTVASTDARAVYVTPGRIEAPGWALDGASLLFSKDGRIEREAATGGQPQTIDTHSATRCDSHHAISPDGQSLAFGDDSQQPGKTAIYIVPVAGGAPRRVTPQVPSWGPTWSSDGKTLAFTAVRGGQFGIYTIPASGGEETPLVTGPGRNEAPEFSPDGAYIYFNSSRSGSRQIWRMKPDGSAQEQVTDDDYNNLYPHVSPDGKRIVFLSYDKNVDVPQDRAVLLRTMILNDAHSAGKPAFLASFNGGLGSIDAPSWSPDSKRLAFVSYQMLP
jgi:Tol biopolymer transport system component